MWSPLVNRMKNDNGNYLIMRRCFELLCIMSVSARDFIRLRTLNDVLPLIQNFLTKSIEDSRFKGKNSVYRMSQEYKLQHILLRELGPLAVYISLQEGHIQPLLSTITPYLSSSQPLPLQVRKNYIFFRGYSIQKELVLSRNSFKGSSSCKFHNYLFFFLSCVL